METGDPKHILIVDDEEDIRLILKTALRRLKPECEVTLASDGFMALSRMFQQSFDLIITDYNMPEMTGLELAEVAHSISPATKTILISGVNPFQNGDSSVSTGLAGFLKKPFSVEQLFKMIEQVNE